MKNKLFNAGIYFLILYSFVACIDFEDPTSESEVKWEIYTTQNGLLNDTVWSLAEDDGGTVWIGTENGLCTIDNSSSNNLEEVDSGYRVNSIKCYGDYVMAATDIGGYILIDGAWYYVSSKFTECIDMEYFEGSFWGLYEDEELFANDYYMGTYIGAKDIYVKDSSLFLCRIGGLYQYYPTANVYSESNGMSSSVCFAMYLSDEETIWGGTFDEKGLSKITDNEIVNYKCGYIRAIAEDLDGSIWAGSQYYGLYKLEANGNIQNITMLDGLPNNEITDILVTQGGTIWVATEGGGIAKLVN